MTFTPLRTLMPYLAISLLAACTTIGPVYTAAPGPKANEALVYVYRPSAPYFAGLSSSFYMDDVKVAGLYMRGYTAFYVPAGEHVLKQNWVSMASDDQTIAIPINLAAGSTSYYRLSIGHARALSTLPFAQAPFVWTLDPVPSPVAVNELAETRFVPPANQDRAVGH